MEKVVIGVIHLLPLPGSPGYTCFDDVVEKAVRDAVALDMGGVDAVLVENFGDSPFLREVGKEIVACMTAVAVEVKNSVSAAIGINVLRNDPIAALAIAKAVGADFIRVNQLYFTSVSPEGLLEGRAGEVLRYKRQIGCRAMIFADISVKHAVHFASVEDYVLNAERSWADALIVTGAATGKAVSLDVLRTVKRATRMPVLAGSGVNAENAEIILKHCDGIIVGSYFKRRGEIDVDRVRKIVRIAKRQG